MAEPGPSDHELREALERIGVADVLVQSLSTITSLAFHRLAPESRDLDQARLAIDTLRAVVPLLRGAVPDELVRDLEAVTANLQLAYADAASAAAGEPEPQAAADEDDPAAAGDDAAAAEDPPSG